MAISKITLIGFYNYMNASGDDLFKYVSFPTGINKDTAIDTILLTGGEFEILYSEKFSNIVFSKSKFSCSWA